MASRALTVAQLKPDDSAPVIPRKTSLRPSAAIRMTKQVRIKDRCEASKEIHC